MPLTDLIRRTEILVLDDIDVESALRSMTRTAAGHPNTLDATRLFTDLMDRESEHTTGIGLGIAVPHARTAAVQETVIVFARCRNPIDFKALDDLPVTLVVLIAVAPDQHKTYIRTLARVAGFLKQGSVREALEAATDPDEIWSILDAC